LNLRSSEEPTRRYPQLRCDEAGRALPHSRGNPQSTPRRHTVSGLTRSRGGIVPLRRHNEIPAYAHVRSLPRFQLLRSAYYARITAERHKLAELRAAGLVVTPG